jgi:CRP/FNR family transcriptional regulator, nitrogen oxide reductase regulator
MNSAATSVGLERCSSASCSTAIKRLSVADHRKNGDICRGTLMEQCPLFTGILPCEHAGICATARIKDFTRGEMLYMEGEPVKQVILLTSGVVKITQLGPNGTEAILRLGVSGEILDAVSLFSAGRHCATAQAFRMCQALVWDTPTFRSVADRFPILYQNMVQVLGDHLLELEERFREVATERVGPRVARQLMRLQEKIGRQINGVVEIGLSRHELAQMTGTTLFTVSRLLSAWEARSIVFARRESVTIRDIESLRAISE